LAGENLRASAESEADIASEPTMLIEFAPLIFGTAGLLAIFLFFSVEEH
jgi:hypothetical protein